MNPMEEKQQQKQQQQKQKKQHKEQNIPLKVKDHLKNGGSFWKMINPTKIMVKLGNQAIKNGGQGLPGIPNFENQHIRNVRKGCAPELPIFKITPPARPIAPFPCSTTHKNSHAFCDLFVSPYHPSM